MKVFELLPRPIGNIFRKLTHFTCNSPACPRRVLQAQRDYFGAHTYERLDSPRGQFFHTNWTGHGGNTSAATYNA